jgi:uncharacterized protein YjbI with pentapeptide repeats
MWQNSNFMHAGKRPWRTAFFVASVASSVALGHAETREPLPRECLRKELRIIRCADVRWTNNELNLFPREAYVVELTGTNKIAPVRSIHPLSFALACSYCSFVAPHFEGLENGGVFPYAHFSGFTMFSGSIDSTVFSDAVFAYVVFSRTKIERARFDASHFDSGRFDTVTVATSADFTRSTAQWLSIIDSRFQGPLDSRGSHWRYATFRGCQFEGTADFGDTEIGSAVIENCIFREPPSFERSRIRGSFSLAGSSFPAGLDLRQIDLSRAKAISLDNIIVQPERLRLRWDQLRANALGPRLTTRPILKAEGDFRDYKAVYENEDQKFLRLEATYKLIAAALYSQGDAEDADEAKYELEDRRQEFSGSIWHRLYGTFLGYGYQPWRIVFAVLIGISAFCVLYAPHALTLAGILNSDIGSGKVPGHLVRRFSRVAYVVLFSGSVFLGIRFQREWVLPTQPGLTALIVSEWIFGLAVYVTFFALVRTSGFAYVKGLLGF